MVKINKLYHPKKDLCRSGLLSIHIMITERCNFKSCGKPCVYCYAPGNHLKDLTIKQLTTIIKKCEGLNKDIFYDISGGNPLMRADWYEVLTLFGKTGRSIYINDNATQINNENANKIKVLSEKFPNQIFWSISLDGHIKEINNKTRSQFDRTIAGIKKLRDRNIDFRIALTLTSYNIKEIKETIKWIVKKLSPKFGIGVLRPVFPMSKENAKLFIALKKIQKTHIEVMSLRREGLKFDFYHCLQDENAKPFCEAGYGKIAIKSNGDITPCYALQSSKDILGNIHNMNINQFRKFINKINSDFIKNDREFLLCEHREDIWGNPPLRLGK